ncbi:hypothetical protein Tco_1030760 [Tanacetum coccineum]|uniref:Uncharacterized protein n=1 Tax=Tanacetum coccineum TaxID=301880 RepID=A0ABQ5G7V3_9ASTR
MLNSNAGDKFLRDYLIGLMLLILSHIGDMIDRPPGEDRDLVVGLLFVCLSMPMWKAMEFEFERPVTYHVFHSHSILKMREKWLIRKKDRRRIMRYMDDGPIRLDIHSIGLNSKERSIGKSE